MLTFPTKVLQGPRSLPVPKSHVSEKFQMPLPRSSAHRIRESQFEEVVPYLDRNARVIALCRSFLFTIIARARPVDND